MEKYITQEQFESLLKELTGKIETGKIEEVREFLNQLSQDAEDSQKYIDRTYVGEVREKKKKQRIDDIIRLLGGMSLKQLENVHDYAMDEYNEPDHEAEALRMIMDLSQKAKLE